MDGRRPALRIAAQDPVMGPASCFRCDWEGDTDAADCPNCGAPLYRVAAPSQPPPGVGPAVRSAEQTRAAPEPADPQGRYLPSDRGLASSQPIRRSRPFTLTVVFALAVTGALWWFLRAHEVPTLGPAGPPAPGGILVYTTGSPDLQRLWFFDIRGGTATEGPLIPDHVLRLVDASGSLHGWVGITMLAADGSQRAGVLRTRTATSRVVPLLGGDLVAWGPNGESAASATMGRSDGGCGRSLVLRRSDTGSRGAERVFNDPDFCGRVRNLGEDAASSYLTLERRTHDPISSSGIYYIGNGRPHRVLADYDMLSMSPTADMLVRPVDGRGAELFWRNAVLPRPYLLGGEPLFIDDVLTWTTGADAALVLGRAGDRRGLFEVDTTPGGSATPRYVGVATGSASAASAGDGSIYIATGSHLEVWRDGMLSEVALPGGAPVPSGPMAWLPG
jgi:hypothetical protein